MKEADIANILGQRLSAPAVIGAVIWENQEVQPVPPYLVLEVVRTDTTDDTLGGGAAVHSGFMQISVVCETNKFSTAALNIADDVADRFPYGLRLPVGSGEILITKPPSIKQGYPDGIHWRVPVRVDYQAYGG